MRILALLPRTTPPGIADCSPRDGARAEHVSCHVPCAADSSVTIGQATVVIPESEATMMVTTQVTGSVPGGVPPEATGGTILPDTNLPSSPTQEGTGPQTLQFGSGGIADSGPGATAGSPSQSAVGGSVSAGGSAISGGTASSVVSSRSSVVPSGSGSGAPPPAASSPTGNSGAERTAGGVVGVIVAGVVGAMLV